MKCTNCGSEVTSGMKFCENCGCEIKAPKRFCENCGSEVTEGMKFCKHCGSPLLSAEAQNPVPQQPVVRFQNKKKLLSGGIVIAAVVVVLVLVLCNIRKEPSGMYSAYYDEDYYTLDFTDDDSIVINMPEYYDDGVSLTCTWKGGVGTIEGYEAYLTYDRKDDTVDFTAGGESMTFYKVD